MITTTHSNQQLMRKLFIVSLAMFGFGFALIPFYQKICEVTGINRLLKQDTVTNTQIDATRVVTIELDSNLRHRIRSPVLSGCVRRAGDVAILAITWLIRRMVDSVVASK